MTVFDRLDTEGTEFVTRLALCNELDKFALQRIYSAAQLSTSIRALGNGLERCHLDTMGLERDEFKSMVIRWLNMDFIGNGQTLTKPNMQSSNHRRGTQLYPALAVDEASAAA